MNPAATSRMQLLARAGLALAACLLLLPTPGHAVTLIVTDDTFINLNNPNKNFGSRKQIKVDDPHDIRGFAKFDLTVLGSLTSNQIGKATLRFFLNRVKVAGSIDIERVTTDWDEGTLDASPPPSTTPLSPPVLIAIAKADQRTFVLVDVTNLVKDWLDGTDNFGIAFLPVSASGIRMAMDSKESRHTSHSMVIEVTQGGATTIIGGGIGDGVLPTAADDEQFVGMFHSDDDADPHDDVTSPMPLEGIVSDFQVLIEGAPGSAGDRYTFFIARESVSGGGPGESSPTNTSITCFIDGGDATPFTCSDVDPTHFQCYKVGDGIVVRVVTVQADDVQEQGMTWTAVFTPQTCTP